MNLHRIITSLAALTLAAHVTAAEVGTAAALTEEGWQLWKSQRFSEALPKFREAVKLAPDSVTAWNGLGWAALNSGNAEEGGKAFEKVLELAPNYPAALNGLGQVYLSQRDYERAERTLLNAAAHNASASWYGLTRIYLLKGQFAEAEKWAQMLVDSSETDGVAKRMLEAAKAKQLDEALRQTIEPPLRPPTAPAKKDAGAAADPQQQGWQLWQSRNYSEAFTKFKEAVASAPTDANAWNGLGWAALQSGKTEEAGKAFGAAIALEPAHGAALNGLGQCYLARRDYAKAEPMLLKAAANHASAAWYGLTRLYLLQGQFADAAKWAQMLVESGRYEGLGPRMLEAAKAKKLSEGLRIDIEPAAQKD